MGRRSSVWVVAPVASLLVFWACAPDTFTGDDSGADAAAGDSHPGMDAPTIDAPPVPEGGQDAPTPPGFSCNTPLQGSLLCADFDNVTNVNDNWTGVLTTNGNVGFDTANFVSSPHSFRAEMPAGAGAFAFAELLYQDTGATYSTMVARTAVRIHAIDKTKVIPLLALSYDTSGGQVRVAIVASQGSFVVYDSQPGPDGGVTGSGTQLAPYQADTWHTLHLSFGEGPSATISAGIGNDAPLTFGASLGAPANGIRSYYLGIEGNQSTDMIVDFDDFDCAGQ
jgi:hypothetical protein